MSCLLCFDQKQYITETKLMANVYLKEAIRVCDTTAGGNSLFRYSASSCQGWRNTQEDVHLVILDFDVDTALFAIFDGHNGVEVAQFVAKYLPMYILSNKKYQKGEIVEGLKEAFVLLDTSMLSKDSINEMREIRKNCYPHIPEMIPGFTSGTTAVVCLVKDHTFYCANIGDSRCVLCRNGEAFPLSHDTKPDEQEEMARIEKAGGLINKGRINKQINVSRAFGDHMYKNNVDLPIYEQMVIAVPDVIVEPFNEQTDQFMVLMCDGIWNSMSNSEVISFVHKRLKTRRLPQVTEEIISRVLPKIMPEKGIVGKDNMSIIIVKFRLYRPKNPILNQVDD